MIYVTHDQIEAMTMADQVVLLQSGRIEQIGAPHELYEHTRNRLCGPFYRIAMNLIQLDQVKTGGPIGRRRPNPGSGREPGLVHRCQTRSNQIKRTRLDGQGWCD